MKEITGQGRLGRAVGLGVLAAALIGCAPSASRGGFDSENPAARLYAIQRAARTGDRAAIPRLVECLDSDDPAVRMMAIEALERLTGSRLGYNPYASDERRAAAVDAWAQAVREGRFGGGPVLAGADSPQPH